MLASAGSGSKGERGLRLGVDRHPGQPGGALGRPHRRHLATGECAYHYCHVPACEPVSLKRLITAAGLRWPAEESFEFGKDYFGLDQSQVRLHTAITRHTVLVMAALAVCVIAAAQSPPANRYPSPAACQPRDAVMRLPLAHALFGADPLSAFQAWYSRWGLAVILIKGMTPIPYKLVTIASGAARFSFRCSWRQASLPAAAASSWSPPCCVRSARRCATSSNGG